MTIEQSVAAIYFILNKLSEDPPILTVQKTQVKICNTIFNHGGQGAKKKKKIEIDIQDGQLRKTIETKKAP